MLVIGENGGFGVHDIHASYRHRRQVCTIEDTHVVFSPILSSCSRSYLLSVWEFYISCLVPTPRIHIIAICYVFGYGILIHTMLCKPFYHIWYQDGPKL